MKVSSNLPPPLPRGTSSAHYVAVAKRLRKAAARAHSEETREELLRLASMYEALAAHAVNPPVSDSRLH